jgi:hypothetical protein
MTMRLKAGYENKTKIRILTINIDKGGFPMLSTGIFGLLDFVPDLRVGELGVADARKQRVESQCNKSEH